MRSKSDKKKSLVPRLRFPEFREAGAWEVKRLGELSEIVRGGSPRPITDYITTDSEGLNWLKIGDVHQNEKYVTSTEEKVKKSAISKTREVYPGDLIMSNSMSFGRPYILKIKTCIHDGWIAVTDINNEVERDYLYYFILSSSSQFYFRNAAAGGGVKNLNADIVKLLSVSLPHYLEQQKIAHCLSSLDEVIGLQAKKVQALKQHKKGLMQQLFPAEGETTPRLRFPEFREAGAWGVKRLGEIYRFKPTNSWSRDQLNYDSGTIKNIHYGDIHKELNRTFRIDDEVVPYVNDTLADSVKEDAFCEEGDIVLADASEDVDDIGKAIEIVDIGGQRLVSGLHTILASRIDHRIVVGFGAYLYASSGVRKQIQQRAQGAKVLGISKTQLAEVELAYPTEAREQQKIAHCLSSLDDVIGLESHKLDALKNLKKGLMQQLFPQDVA